MRLTFIHGINQAGRQEAGLKSDWETALLNAWTVAGLTKPEYDIRMPFYGDKIIEMIDEVRGSSGNVLSRGAGNYVSFSETERELVFELAKRAGATEAEIETQTDRAVIDRGPANWEWVQAAARWLSKKAPWLGNSSLEYLPIIREADAYLTRPHIRNAIDAMTIPHLEGEETVVVAHSLGSVIAYKLLRHLGKKAIVNLLITLGTPLGIDVVKDHLKPPKLQKPTGVVSWLNGSDERDYVALHSALTKETFAAGIDNLSDIKNSKKDPHAILDYLSDARVSARVNSALTVSETRG